MDSEPQELEKNDSAFIWDEKSQLYFHASSGFYHDPNAGWYYSSIDGVYYKFEDGKYVPLDSNKEDDCGETYPCKETTPENPQGIHGIDNEDNPSFLGSQCDTTEQTGILADEAADDAMNSTSSPTCENPPPPPSEWLEDTLIDLYLSGYNKTALSAADTLAVPLETDGYDSTLGVDAYSNTYEMEGEWTTGPVDENGIADSRSIVDEGIAYNNCYEMEEGEWIPDPEDENHLADRSTIDEGILSDEEKWRAQYGQVIESGKDLISELSILDLWDWEMVKGSKRDRKDKAARLVGRLVKHSAKQHPSISSGGRKLRSAPIWEVHLDLVRVKTGQVYRLRNPSARYVASLSTYDSSNPTEDWDFPQLSSNKNITHVSKSGESTPASNEISTEKDLSMLPNQLSASKQIKSHYRDRAAERRTLHGGFGVGPGQKNLEGSYDTPSSTVDCPQEEATAEALKMSFGPGSYARKLLEGMGWNEGEGLGSSTKGLVEPIQAVGNIGSAGLGWPRRN